MKAAFLALLFSLPTLAFTQQSSLFYPLEEGGSYKLVCTNKKGKQLSSEIHKVVFLESLPTGTKGTIECSAFDVKDKLVHQFTYQVEVNSQTTMIDWRSRLTGVQNAIPAPLIQEGLPCFLELPNNPEVGQTFPDCVISYEKRKASYKAKFTEIKIIAREPLTLSGKVTEAFVLEYRFTTELVEGLSISFQKYHKDWYVPGKGIVKSSCGGSTRKPKPEDEHDFFTELSMN